MLGRGTRRGRSVRGRHVDSWPDVEVTDEELSGLGDLSTEKFELVRKGSYAGEGILIDKDRDKVIGEVSIDVVDSPYAISHYFGEIKRRIERAKTE